MLALIVDEADNAFADVYSASVSTQDIFPKINQKMPYRWVHCTQCYTGDGGFYRAMRSVLAFDRSNIVPLFGVVLTDYYIVKRQKYTEQMLYVRQNGLGRSTCNNCMDSWGSAKLHTVSPLAHLHSSCRL